MVVVELQCTGEFFCEHSRSVEDAAGLIRRGKVDRAEVFAVSGDGAVRAGEVHPIGGDKFLSADAGDDIGGRVVLLQRAGLRTRIHPYPRGRHGLIGEFLGGTIGREAPEAYIVVLVTG